MQLINRMFDTIGHYTQGDFKSREDYKQGFLDLHIREIVAIFAKAYPHWTYHTLREGGHMAPLTHR